MLQVISFAFLYKHVFQIGFKLAQLLQAQYIESILIWQITSSCCWKTDKAKGRCCFRGWTCVFRHIFLSGLLLYESFSAKAEPVIPGHIISKCNYETLMPCKKHVCRCTYCSKQWMTEKCSWSLQLFPLLKAFLYQRFGDSVNSGTNPDWMCPRGILSHLTMSFFLGLQSRLCLKTFFFFFVFFFFFSPPPNIVWLKYG